MSGRSSRSTLMATTLSFTTLAVAASSNDSCAITWLQWQAAYPTESSTGTSRRRASANASSDQGHQSTGLSACCSRYGLVALLSRFAIPQLLRGTDPAAAKGPRTQASEIEDSTDGADEEAKRPVRLVRQGDRQPDGGQGDEHGERQGGAR